MLQLIIDARVDDDESQDTSSQTKKKLTDEDIVALATGWLRDYQQHTRLHILPAGTQY